MTFISSHNHLQNTTKTAIVTGSSRGIGKAIALSFAKRGYNLVILSKNSLEELLQTKEEIKNYGCECLSFVGDVSDPEFAYHVITKTLQTFSTIDCLVNNAGISHIGLMTDLTLEQWNTILQTNLSSIFYFSRLVIPHMVQKQQGSIINISSIWGEVGASCEVAYSATKGGMNAFTKALAKELAPSKIAVNAISCGAIATKMNEWLSDDETQSLIEEIPANRLGTPEEIGELAYQLSNMTSYFTGQIVRIDGGLI